MIIQELDKETVRSELNEVNQQICIISYGGCGSNTLENSLNINHYKTTSSIWRYILCHCPQLIDIDIPIIYIYRNPIHAFLSMKKRGNGIWDLNQQKLNNDWNIELSDENLLKSMIKQFHIWTTSNLDNVLIINYDEVFAEGIKEKLEFFLGKYNLHNRLNCFPIEYIKTNEYSEDNFTIDEKNLFEKYKKEIDHINNFGKMNETVIPKNIFQTWFTKELPPKMKETVENLKTKHPDFNYEFFDDSDCRQFIEENFENDVLSAFDKLIPGAYKADLWRYCVLYIRGGIYLDIKFNTTDEFTLNDFLDKEYFVRDLPTFGRRGIYNAFMVCKKGNPILMNAIKRIVENVKNQFYGNNPLEVTGPELLVNYFDEDTINRLDFYLELNQDNTCKIMNDNKCVLFMYQEYFEERNRYQKNEYYLNLWRNRAIYQNL